MDIIRNAFIKIFEDGKIPNEFLLASYSKDAEIFYRKLSQDKPSLHALIGEYGTGKTTFLNAVSSLKSTKDNHDVWITFEARKYPNRKELRDAFIIEVISKLGVNLINDKNKDVIKKGIQNKLIERMEKGYYTQFDLNKDKGDKALKVIGENIAGVFDTIISGLFSTTTPGFNATITKDAFNACTKISDIYSVGNFGVERLFDYESFFEELWCEIIHENQILGDGRVYVIIEDIDRCGDDGLIFLETLSYFIKSVASENWMGNKLTAIVSIGQGFLNNNRHLINKAIPSYDIFKMRKDSIIEYFNHSIQSVGFNEAQKLKVINFINFLLDNRHGYQRTIREIKYLFKKVLGFIIEKLPANNTDDEILNILILNVALFIRCNAEPFDDNTKHFVEFFDSTKGLYYCTILANGNVHYPFSKSYRSLNHILSYLLDSLKIINPGNVHSIDSIANITSGKNDVENSDYYIFSYIKTSGGPVKYNLVLNEFRLLDN